MKRAEELLKKLKRLDKIPLHGYDVRGKPDSIQTVSVNGELLVPRWHKRCRQYKINLINQFKKDSDDLLKVYEELPKYVGKTLDVHELMAVKKLYDKIKQLTKE